jgi:hypothetical protein
MALLIKRGKIEAKENISYVNPAGIVYKLYRFHQLPLVFPLSPEKVEEGERYLAVLEFNEETGEARVIALEKTDNPQSLNEIAGILKVKKAGNKLFAGKFEILIKTQKNDNEIKFPFRGRATFVGKKIVFKEDKEGNCVLVDSNP